MDNKTKNWKDIAIALAKILWEGCERADSCQEDCLIVPCPIHNLKSSNTIENWIALAQGEPIYRSEKESQAPQNENNEIIELQQMLKTSMAQCERMQLMELATKRKYNLEMYSFDEICRMLVNKIKRQNRLDEADRAKYEKIKRIING